MNKKLSDDDLGGLGLPGWVNIPVIILAIGVFGLIRYDLITQVEFQKARVVSVQNIAGRGGHERFVTVELGKNRRVMRTGDWMLRTKPGGEVCVAKRQFLLRRWVRYRLALPFYCRNLEQPVLVPSRSPP